MSCPGVPIDEAPTTPTATLATPTLHLRYTHYTATLLHRYTLPTVHGYTATHCLHRYTTSPLLHSLHLLLPLHTATPLHCFTLATLAIHQTKIHHRDFFGSNTNQTIHRFTATHCLHHYTAFTTTLLPPRYTLSTPLHLPYMTRGCKRAGIFGSARIITVKHPSRRHERGACFMCVFVCI